MSHFITLAIDAMGGDSAPCSVIQGLSLIAARYHDVRFLIFGNKKDVLPLIEDCLVLKKQSEFVQAPELVLSDMKPTAALKLRASSMRQAIEAVQNNQASAVISAGNSGALLALSKIVLKTMVDVDRPALAAVIPSRTGPSVMLDLGANIECDARNLVEFALLGECFARAVLGDEAPTIGLINVGSEELKGKEVLREAAEMLKRSPVSSRFIGFIEGYDIWKGIARVNVADGFSGNISLKTAEGLADYLVDNLKQAFQNSLSGRLAYLVGRSALKKFRQKTDPTQYNGAVLLGLNGVVVKSHGGADAAGFAQAVEVAYRMVAYNFNQQIHDGLTKAFTEN